MVRVIVSPVTTDNKFYTMMFSSVDRSTVFDEFTQRWSALELPQFKTIVYQLNVDNKRLVSCIVGRDATPPPECQNIPAQPSLIKTSLSFTLYALDDVSTLMQNAQLVFHSYGDVAIRVGDGRLYPLIQDLPVETPHGIVLVSYDKLTVDRIIDDQGNEVSTNVGFRLIIGFRRIYGNRYTAFLLTTAAVCFTGVGPGTYQVGPVYNNQVQPGFFVINSKNVSFRMFAVLDMLEEVLNEQETLSPLKYRVKYNMEATLTMKMYLLNEDALQYKSGEFTIKFYDQNANIVYSMSDTFEEVAFIKYAGEPQPPSARLGSLAPAP